MDFELPQYFIKNSNYERNANRNLNKLPLHSSVCHVTIVKDREKKKCLFTIGTQVD